MYHPIYLAEKLWRIEEDFPPQNYDINLDTINFHYKHVEPFKCSICKKEAFYIRNGYCKVCHTNINTIGNALELGLLVVEDFRGEYLIPQYIYALLHVKVYIHMMKEMFNDWDDRTPSDIPHENTEGFYLRLSYRCKKYHEIEKSVKSILDGKISTATMNKCFARLEKDYNKVDLTTTVMCII